MLNNKVKVKAILYIIISIIFILFIKNIILNFLFQGFWLFGIIMVFFILIPIIYLYTGFSELSSIQKNVNSQKINNYSFFRSKYILSNIIVIPIIWIIFKIGAVFNIMGLGNDSGFISAEATVIIFTILAGIFYLNLSILLYFILPYNKSIKILWKESFTKKVESFGMIYIGIGIIFIFIYIISMIFNIRF